VLIAMIKKELHLDASLYTLLQILSALQPDATKTISPPIGNQLILFDF
jgi:hypothetical protein